MAGLGIAAEHAAAAAIVAVEAAVAVATEAAIEAVSVARTVACHATVAAMLSAAASDQWIAEGVWPVYVSAAVVAIVDVPGPTVADVVNQPALKVVAAKAEIAH